MNLKENVKNSSFGRSKAFDIISKVWSFLLAQWFFIILGALVALAHSYPDFAKQGGTIKAQYTIEYGAVAVIFLVSGMSMSTKNLTINILNFRAHFTVLSLSFLITSSIIFGISCGIKAANDAEIDEWLLVGMIVTHSCPTTVSSNVVMTKLAHGNDILTLCEVFIGNILGTFITPALVQLYLQGGWAFGNPSLQDGSSINSLYANVMKQVGLSVFVPLFVGQVAQNIIPKITKWCLAKLYLGKVSQFMLLLIMFQSFSTAFAQDAFTSVSHVSIIFLVFFNIGIYIFFTAISFVYSRPYFILKIFSTKPDENSSKFYTYTYNFFRPFYYSRKDTVAILLCGPAKTAALGVSLVSSQYGSSFSKLGVLLVPLVLYQAEQVITAQILTTFMKKWIEAEEIKEDEENHLQDADRPEGDETEYPEQPESPKKSKFIDNKDGSISNEGETSRDQSSTAS